MDLILGRARRLESIVSICILAILFLIGLGVFLKQSNVDMGRFGTDPVAAGVVEPQNNSKPRKTLRSLAPQGFRTLSEAEVYEPENLYEKIDGKAPLYIESGFVKLFTQRFISNNDEELWMELFVYDMAAIKNAFSVYSVQKRAGVELLPSMQFGYKTSNGLYFVHGGYYVELLGSAESAQLVQVMEEIAQKLGKHFDIDQDAKIAELALFPEEDLVQGSTKLYLASAFGFEGLTNTFAARYKFGDESITAFLSRRADPQDARLVAESYYKFLIANGGTVKPAVNQAVATIESKVVDFYGTTEIVLAIGPFVAGVHEAENQTSAEKLAVQLANKLGAVAKAMDNE